MSHYQYFRNRQGSTMAVVDDSGAVVQRTGYYPTGTPFVLPVDAADSNGTPALDGVTDRLHIGNRRMGLSGLAMYDNSARVHDPVMPHFLTADKYASKYYNFSPFSHCGGNPANMVDWDGNDIFLFDSASNLIDYEKNDGNDVIRIMQDNVTCFLRLEKGSIKLFSDCTNSDNNYNTEEGNLILQVVEKSASRVYEYMSENTQAEWGHTESNSGEHFVTTGHSHGNEPGMTEISNILVDERKTIPRNSHSHPEGTELPSDSDVRMIKSINHRNKKNDPNAPKIESTIYIPGKHKYINYNEKSKCATRQNN